MKRILSVIPITKPISKSSTVEVYCHQVLSNAINLARQERRYEIIPEVRRCFRESEKYHFNRLAAEFSHYLHFYYYVVRQDKIRGKKYGKKYEVFFQLAQIEDKCRTIYAELTYELNRTRKPSADLIAKLDQQCEALRPYLAKKNAHISIWIYPLLVAQAYLRLQYPEVIRICYEAIDLYERLEVNRAQHFYNYITPVLILEKRHDEARTMIDRAMADIQKGEYSWSVFLYNKILNELHAGAYQTAFELLMTAAKKGQINKAMAEQWLLVKAYLQFLIDAGAIETDMVFRVNKFLNEVPIFDKDKPGNFINILILKVLIDIKSRRGRLVDNYQAIERAAHRYVEKGSREQLFLRMLIRVPTAHFKVPVIIQRCEEDLKYLQSLPLTADRIEIVPYEQLWELLIGMLD